MGFKEQDIINYFIDFYPGIIDNIVIINCEKGYIEFEYKTQKSDIRPGNCIAGPTIMRATDLGGFLAILTTKGASSNSFTTNLNINFLNKAPENNSLYLKCSILKTGKNLINVEVETYTHEFKKIISHAIVTFTNG